MSTSDSTTQVEYRELERFPGYRFGSDGSVWSCWQRHAVQSADTRLIGCIRTISDQWKRMTPSLMSIGYYVVTLSSADGKRRVYRLHRLILEAFAGPCPPSSECCHNDGNSRNNVISNLRWDTRKANHADKKKHGTSFTGSRNPWSKLTEEKVKEIRRLSAAGVKQVEIAARFNVSPCAVSHVVCRRTWSHV